MKKVSARTLVITALLAVASAVGVSTMHTDTAPQSIETASVGVPVANAAALPTLPKRSYLRYHGDPTQETAEGELILDAEQRFLDMLTIKGAVAGTRNENLERGYMVCEFYFEEGNLDKVLARINAETPDQQEVKRLTELTVPVVQTICPENKFKL